MDKKNEAADVRQGAIPLLNPVYQICYVVDDLDRAVRLWASQFGFGPFMAVEHLRFDELVYNGENTEVDISIALAWRGELQIELLQQHSDGASIFTEFTPPNGGIHHVGIRSNSIDEDEKKLVAAGFRRVQRGVSSTGVVTVFLDGGKSVGLVELISVPDGGASGEKLKRASVEWDRIDPYLK